MKVICVDTGIWELRKIKKLIQKPMSEAAEMLIRQFVKPYSAERIEKAFERLRYSIK